MKHATIAVAAAALCAPCALAAPSNDGYKHSKKPLVTPEALIKEVYESDLREGAYVLQGISDQYNGTRVFASPGHVATLDYLQATLGRTGYYDVTAQALETYSYTPTANTTLEINGQTAEFITPEYSADGVVSGDLIFAGIGCDASEFPSTVSGQIALVDRGTCEFGLKVALAQSAGAVGVVIANNDETEPDSPGDSVTLSTPGRPEGDYVPTVLISLNLGATVRSGGTASIGVFAETVLLTTHNILARSKAGDQNNVITLGAHTDSVLAGPGINDDGSGTIALLALANKLTLFNVNNAVQFSFWTAEESGLVGSTYYVENLSESEIKKIRMNINIDMIASPNYAYLIYDGDGDVFDLTGPSGSAEIEATFQKYFNSTGTPYNATAFDGRSDYGPFLDAGIPAGGLFTGAEEIKTDFDVERFGGTAGIAYDPNYHQAGDDINNLSYEAWVFNTKAVAYAIGKYAASLEGFPANNATAITPTRKRALHHERDLKAGKRSHKSCGPKDSE